jgi:hypothetical protein
VHQTELFAAPALAARGLPFTRENPPPNYEAMQTPVSAAAGRQVVWLHHSLLLSGTDVLDDVAETLTELQRRPPAPAG